MAAQRLLMYQIDHVKYRVRGMVEEKREKIYKERDTEINKIKKPDLLTPKDAARAFNDGDFDIPLRGLKTSASREERYYYDPNACLIDIMKLSGYAKENEQRIAKHEKRCQQAGKKYTKRVDAAHRAGEDLITRLVLGGAEEFEKAITAFESKTF